MGRSHRAQVSERANAGGKLTVARRAGERPRRSEPGQGWSGDELAWRRAIGSGVSPAALLPLQRLAGNAAVGHLVAQRQTGRDGPPSGLTCPVSTAPPPEVGTAVIFERGGSTVGPELDAVVRGFVRIWNRVRLTRPGQVGDVVVVDGYGSTVGPAALNWRLSCRRAEAVRAVLVAAGVPAASINVFAHGATSVFDAAPLRNQRVVISTINTAGYRGTFTPPPSGTSPGLGARKQALMTAGGNLLDMAVAMLETEHMDAGDYPFGDGKTLDAANFGIFKQNWHYIRTSGAMPAQPSPIASGLGLSRADWPRGAALNVDLALDVRVLHASQSQLGLGQWFAAHRWGETGQLAFAAAAGGAPTAAQRATLSDIGNYQNAVEWIRGQLVRDPTLQRDDRKVFVQVPAV